MTTTQITYSNDTLKELTFPLFQGVETREGYGACVDVLDEETVMFSWENGTEDGSSCVEINVHAKEWVIIQAECLEYAHEHVTAALWGDPDSIESIFHWTGDGHDVLISQIYNIKGLEGFVQRIITIPASELDGLQ